MAFAFDDKIPKQEFACFSFSSEGAMGTIPRSSRNSSNTSDNSTTDSTPNTTTISISIKHEMVVAIVIIIVVTMISRIVMGQVVLVLHATTIAFEIVMVTGITLIVILVTR